MNDEMYLVIDGDSWMLDRHEPVQLPAAHVHGQLVCLALIGILNDLLTLFRSFVPVVLKSPKRGEVY